MARSVEESQVRWKGHRFSGGSLGSVKGHKFGGRWPASQDTTNTQTDAPQHRPSHATRAPAPAPAPVAVTKQQRDMTRGEREEARKIDIRVAPRACTILAVPAVRTALSINRSSLAFGNQTQVCLSCWKEWEVRKVTDWLVDWLTGCSAAGWLCVVVLACLGQMCASGEPFHLQSPCAHRAWRWAPVEARLWEVCCRVAVKPDQIRAPARQVCTFVAQVPHFSG